MSRDLFSGHAKEYAAYRPNYPFELYQFILQHVVHRSAAWDCATGNGQAAKELANHFTVVHASDLSQQQVNNAYKAPNIHYTVCESEATPYADNSFDLIAIAQAYHWLDFERFNKEAYRVARNECLIAAWGYGLIESESHDVNAGIRKLYKDVIGSYWDYERKYIDANYSDVPFAFREIETPPFKMHVLHTVESLVNYLNTWSAVKHFIKKKQVNPVDELKAELLHLWPAEKELQCQFPLFLRLGRILK